MKDAKVSLGEFLGMELSEKDIENIKTGYNMLYTEFKKSPEQASRNFIDHKSILKKYVLTKRDSKPMATTAKFAEELYSSSEKQNEIIKEFGKRLEKAKIDQEDLIKNNKISLKGIEEEKLKEIEFQKETEKIYKNIKRFSRKCKSTLKFRSYKPSTWHFIINK